MRLSIIVPAYNEERYLPRLLSSLRYARLTLRDTAPGVDVEVIVVDNASTDATASVAAGHGARTLTEPRRGIAVARNTGAADAAGDVLVFIDADYRVSADFLTQLHYQLASANPPDALGTRVALEPEEIDPVTRLIAAYGLWLLRRVRRMSFGVFVLSRSAFADLGGFAEDLYAFEDVDLLERVAAAGLDYRVVPTVAYASARGFYRGGMLRTYLHMALRRRSRRDLHRCGYWYER